MDDVSPSMILENKEFLDSFRRTAKKSILELSNDVQIAPPGGIVTRTLAAPAISGDLDLIIESNQLNVNKDELDKWLRTDARSSPDEIRRIEERILPALLESPALRVQSFQNHISGASNSSFSRRLQVCKISVNSNDGLIKTQGTGIFLTEQLVLTCRHVLGDRNKLDENSVKIHVPYFHGPVVNRRLLGEASGWAYTDFYVKTSLNKPIFLSESQAFDELIETGSWDVPIEPPSPRLDYCIVEVDEKTKKWNMHINAGEEDLSALNLFEIVKALNNQKPIVIMPPQLYEAEELENKTVQVHTLSQGLVVDSIPGGSVLSTNSVLQRIRYGTGQLLEEGDSGSPVVDERGVLIALHNAGATDVFGQAIPIGEILMDIQQKDDALFEMLVSESRS